MNDLTACCSVGFIMCQIRILVPTMRNCLLGLVITILNSFLGPHFWFSYQALSSSWVPLGFSFPSQLTSWHQCWRLPLKFHREPRVLNHGFLCLQSLWTPLQSLSYTYLCSVLWLSWPFHISCTQPYPKAVCVTEASLPPRPIGSFFSTFWRS